MTVPGRRFFAVLGKTLFGLGVFSATMGAWAAYQYRAAMHAPLPSAGGRQGRCVVWFVGSSSFFRWSTLARDMQPWITHNRGVAGALLPELTQRFANEGPVTPPEAIVFYGGDNDIAHGTSVKEAAAQMATFVAAERAKMPGVPLLLLSVKPSPKRWSMRSTQTALDQWMREEARHTPGVAFVDASAGLIENGRPGPYFIEDGVHMAPAGYRIWARAVHAALQAALPPAAVKSCASPEAVRP